MQRQEQSFQRAAIERRIVVMICGCSDSQCQCDRFGGVGGGRMLMTTIEVQKKITPALPRLWSVSGPVTAVGGGGTALVREGSPNLGWVWRNWIIVIMSSFFLKLNDTHPQARNSN